MKSECCAASYLSQIYTNDNSIYSSPLGEINGEWEDEERMGNCEVDDERRRLCRLCWSPLVPVSLLLGSVVGGGVSSFLRGLWPRLCIPCNSHYTASVFAD